MDLLCTENIEGDTLCQQQQQQQQEKHNKLESLEIKTTNSLSPAVYSSNISLASTSQASSGYHSSSSGSSSDSSDSINVAKCEHHFKKQSTSKEVASERNTSAAVKTSYVDTKNYNNNNNNNKHFIINRPMDYVNTAAEDPTFLTDRCLENALKAEEKRPQPVCTYFKTVQDEITPPMRKIVAEWMMEVCAEEKCQEEVVLVALNYMDRFLSIKSVRKTHLQILAAACLLLASKLREPSCRALSAELLVFYTDNSIHKTDLIKWELFVLSSLHWDLSCVTPLDFLELLLIRLPIRTRNCPDLDVDKVREHAQAFISLAAKEHHFSLYTASTIAASSIAAALSGLNWHLRAGQNLRHLFNLLTDLTSVEQDYLYDCMTKMEKTFEEHSRNLQTYLPSTDRKSPTIPSSTSLTTSSSSNSSSSSTTAATKCYISQQYPHQQQQSRQTMNLGVPFIPITHSPSSTYPHSHYCQYKQQQQQQQQQYQPHLYHCQHPPQYHHKSSTCVANNGKVSGNSNSSNTVLLPDLTQTCKMQANAQKDVQDIKF